LALLTTRDRRTEKQLRSEVKELKHIKRGKKKKRKKKVWGQNSLCREKERSSSLVLGKVG